jgi:hypothetical protein
VSSETLREYLISLGWKSNDPEQRKFFDALEGATLRAKLLGDALEAVALRAVDAVSTIADSYDKLYFSSQRNHASVEVIKAIGYAASQTGSSVQEAAAAIETMGRMLRENKNNEYYLNKVGFQSNAATGQIEYNKKLGEQFAALKPSQQELWGHKANLSETMIASLAHPDEFAKAYQESLDTMKKSGLDAGAAAKDANAFMTQFRDLWNQLGALADGGLTRLMNGLIPVLKAFSDFLKDHQTEIGADINAMADGIAKFVAALAGKFEDFLSKPENIDKIAKALGDFGADIGHAAESLDKFGTKFDKLLTLAEKAASMGNGIKDFLNNIIGAENSFGESGGIRGWLGRTFGGGSSGGSGAIGPQGAAGYKKIYDAAKAAGDPFPEVTASQWALESGWGKKTPAGSNNYFGQTTDGIPGHWKNYDTPEEGLADHIKRWAPKYGKARTPEEAIHNLVASGYSPDEGYADSVLNVMKLGEQSRTAPPAGPSSLGSTPDEIFDNLKKMRDAGLVSNEQCVSLAAAAAGLKPGEWNVHDWRRGDAASGGGLQPGQPVATFLDPAGNVSDRYAGGGSGTPGANRDHAGVFLNYIRDNNGQIIGMTMAEQYQGSGGIHERAYYFGNGSGEIDASNYFGIRNGGSTLQGLGGRSASPWAGFNPTGLSGRGTPLDGQLWTGASSSGAASPSVANVNSTTNVHVDGAQDPSIVAHMVAAHQDRVSSDLVRNVQGAIQ